MGVSNRHGDLFVPHKVLDGSETLSDHYQPGCKSMTQTVPREIPNLRSLEDRLEPKAGSGETTLALVPKNMSRWSAHFAQRFERGVRRAV